MTQPSSEGSLRGLGNRGEARRQNYRLFASVVAIIAMACVLLVVPAALAAGRGENQGSERSTNASSNGNSHAAENADKGMNRESGPGEWKDNGHSPSANSSPQGFSPSDPDNGGNGGLDKPGEDGGYDADRDGNNGCGNDTDREDDNNGWCGKPPTSATPSPSPTVTVSPTTSAVVLGVRVEAPEILGVSTPGLARTGLALAELVVGASALTLVGIALRKGARTAR